MRHVWDYLTSPGRSLTQYVLRLAPLLIVGWAILQTALFIPGLITRSMRVEWSPRPERLLDAEAVQWVGMATLACVIASVLAWALVLALKCMLRNRAMIALTIGALVAAPIFFAVLSARGAPAASLALAGYFGWVGFVATIAVQVGRLTSNRHGVAASSLVLTMTAIVVGLISSSITPRATACEERLPPERERCISRTELVSVMLEDWLLFEKLSTDSPGDGWDE